MMKDENKWYYVTDSMMDDESTILLTNAAITPDFLNYQCVGKRFECVGFAVRQLDINGDDCTNCILFDEDGNSYSTISKGIAKVVGTWIECELNPSWEKPITVEYGQEQKGTYRYYTLKAIPKKRRNNKEELKK